jgi:hypothetical protein
MNAPVRLEQSTRILARLARALMVGPGLVTALAISFGCDEGSKGNTLAEPPPAPPLPTAPASAEPARAPDIVVDVSNVAVGNDRVGTSEPGLAQKVAVFLNGRPLVEGHTVDVVAMRNTKPSYVAAVLTALRQAKASGVVVKSEARDNSTQRLPVSFTTNVPACATVAWIAKDAAVDVWPAAGGTAKRIVKGLAGPDVTLGTDAISGQAAKCDASELVVGADDAMTWGLVFDLAMTGLHAPGARTSTVVLVTNPTPGRKLVLE